MFFKADTLDDAMGDVMRRLLRRGTRIRSNKGPAREFTGVLIKLSDPRARLSRTEDRGVVISFLGETLWYLSGSDRLDHIEYYIPRYRSFINASPRAKRAPGAYGPRLFGGEKSQIAGLISNLKAKQGSSDTRQAVAQVFSRSDLKAGNGDVPCTTTLQFLPRHGKLDLAVTMRSNDVYRGFPGDVFAFIFIQELVARTLGIEVGTYSHFVGSLHLYDADVSSARDCINEGFQSPIRMPDMPMGDPWLAVKWLLEIENSTRLSLPEPSSAGFDSYWIDLARLLQIKSLYNRRAMRQLAQLKTQMAGPVYNAFIRGREASLQRRIDPQPTLPGIQPIVQPIGAR